MCEELVEALRNGKSLNNVAVGGGVLRDLLVEALRRGESLAGATVQASDLVIAFTQLASQAEAAEQRPTLRDAVVVGKLSIPAGSRRGFRIIRFYGCEIRERFELAPQLSSRLIFQDVVFEDRTVLNFGLLSDQNLIVINECRFLDALDVLGEAGRRIETTTQLGRVYSTRTLAFTKCSFAGESRFRLKGDLGEVSFAQSRFGPSSDTQVDLGHGSWQCLNLAGAFPDGLFSVTHASADQSIPNPGLRQISFWGTRLTGIVNVSRSGVGQLDLRNSTIRAGAIRLPRHSPASLVLAGMTDLPSGFFTTCQTAIGMLWDRKFVQPVSAAEPSADTDVDAASTAIAVVRSTGPRANAAAAVGNATRAPDSPDAQNESTDSLSAELGLRERLYDAASQYEALRDCCLRESNHDDYADIGHYYARQYAAMADLVQAPVIALLILAVSLVWLGGLIWAIARSPSDQLCLAIAAALPALFLLIKWWTSSRFRDSAYRTVNAVWSLVVLRYMLGYGVWLPNVLMTSLVMIFGFATVYHVSSGHTPAYGIVAETNPQKTAGISFLSGEKHLKGGTNSGNASTDGTLTPPAETPPAGSRRPEPPVQNEPQSPLSALSLQRAFYYSVVTFTTLGDGDFRPVGRMLAVAAVEAMTGALMISLVVVVFARRFLRL